MTRITLGEFLSTRPRASIMANGNGESLVVWPHELHAAELLHLVGAIDAYGTWHWLREEQLTHPWFADRHEITAESPSHFLFDRPTSGTLGSAQINDKTFTLTESIDWPDGEIMEVVERGVWRCQPDGTRIAFTAFLEAPCPQQP